MMTVADYQAYLAANPVKKKSKYGNKITVVDGVTYHSIAEATYAGRLLLQKKAGLIEDFFYHVKIPLHGADGSLLYHYESDFIIIHHSGEWDIIDIKAGKVTMTQVFRNKAKQVLAEYGIPVLCIDSKTFLPIKKKSHAARRKKTP